ncbi:DegT/DnrJ/EryC1/StrS aminotransferase family protein [Polynucleobacter paneuropaeus]|uniref:DegT/DnrJ/EryC1/StrS family aminotransferase n=1 Tax=Polynucleobacter paneuropaeus TaxID=2527775 RepID=A0A2Z4JUN5_9BURK|nr:DegT/DnrJ/EryC1/StrS family aminotransferase [Polynucleobacter paneuropaeus]AWW50608.1 DegT/DnrJ/EryC1/StrS family aminotransferase [Polynucleobacter paneuropaeus]QWD44321.1 DegT/DnrJ/EryC1/StrS family aminotransferase [Polynucleobacter paneuropaeus]
MKHKKMNEFPLMDPSKGLVLFYPDISPNAINSVNETLSGRWIGQGPKVESFQNEFTKKFLHSGSSLAVGSGTDALHLAYILAGINDGDEVLAPAFTCTATNIPLLYLNANIKFIDIDPKTMNLSLEDIKQKVSPKTKAIVTVDYGGIPCEYDELKKISAVNGIALIQDAAHSIGSKYGENYVGNQSDFTIFSFQAIKTLTTGDGGMLVMKNANLNERAKKLRWFGIDRAQKQGGIWENDIQDIGYKYQMNDIAAAIGLSNLECFDDIVNARKELYERYLGGLKEVQGISVIQPVSKKTVDFCPWLLTIIVDKNRAGLMKKLRENSVESGQVHYRNDRYSIFGTQKQELPNMDFLEDKYLVLPLHRKMTVDDVDRVVSIIKEGW